MGFFEGEKYRSSQTHLSMLQSAHSESDCDTSRTTPTPPLSSLSELPTKESQSEYETEPEIEEEQSPPHHVLSLITRNFIQFKTFCQIETKWKNWPTTELTHSIESLRDAIMIPVNNKIVIFHKRCGFISGAQQLTVETATMENITLPDSSIGCVELALFCRLNDTILCFPRTHQKNFHR